MNVSKPLFVTHIEPEGPFLKIWGQTDKNTVGLIESLMRSAIPQFKEGLCNVALESLAPGQLACAKYKDDTYYRARILNVLPSGFVEVMFLDYGNREFVAFNDLRHTQLFPPHFASIPPLAHPFIFAEAHAPGGRDWNPTTIEHLSKELKYHELLSTYVAPAGQYQLIALTHNGTNLAQLLSGFIQHIPIQVQQAVLISLNLKTPVMMPQQTIPTPIATSAELNTYKAVTLETGKQYPVFVSYVNDGPCHFSIQLESSLDNLGKLMKEVNSINLKMLDDVPIPGTICLARCEDDGNICRAVVTNEVDNQFKVFYVDFGNYEIVPLTSLYQIPFKYVLPKVMAIRFSLAGVEKSTVTLEMQCAFKKFVDDRLLHMTVLSGRTKLAVPKCELYDPQTETSALDVVNRAARNAYPDPMSLNRGFSQTVKVSYVYSCNRFYVQLCSKEAELEKLMVDLQDSCRSNEPMDPASLTVGLPCCALYEDDQKWYRSQIVEILEGGNVKVRYIDYGNEEIVPNTVLKLVEGEQLTVLRPQAIECCLNGYQNMEVDTARDNLLEQLILEQQFTMKVVEMIGTKALVELIDSSNYNVASLLLDKIASATSQVSPMLVQANNRIEHRKSLKQDGGYNRDFKDRKPGRENRPWNNERGGEKPWNDKNNDRQWNDRNIERSPDKPWRQDDQNTRNDKYANDGGDQASWRQTNKGFNNRNENRYDNQNRTDNRGNRGFERKNNRTDNRASSSMEGGDVVGWNHPKSAAANNNWDKSKGDGFRKDNRDNFKNRNSPKGKDDGTSISPQKGNFKKRDFAREGSEMSSSGSEKSLHKGPRTSSRNDRFTKRGDQQPKNLSFGNDSWDVSAVSIDAAPSDARFKTYNCMGTEAKVHISWFHSPGHFYCQKKEHQDVFKKLMEDIQQAYKGRKPDKAKRGAPVVGLFPEDNVLYRAQVLEVLGNEYKVYYVDFGNVSVVKKVWPIEKKFMELPAQAICCELADVQPFEGQWQSPEMYAAFFDKEEFDCKFVSTNNGKTQVNLLHSGINIAHKLAENNLAVHLAMMVQTIDFSILVGQQFKVILKSVNNLADIIVALYSGVALSCKAHNLDVASETREDKLKEYLEQPVIIYVDNVCESVLEVTFYDVEGNKLPIVSPDEGAYDTVESICPLLILYTTVYGYVPHVTESSVFIQPIEYMQGVNYLLEEMFQFYDGKTQESPIIPEEEYVYAVLSEDTNWYRGKVRSFDDEKAEVIYIDYGNSESVQFTALRSLAPQFQAYSMLCFEVKVTIPTEQFIERDVVATISLGEEGWEGEVQLQQPTQTEVAVEAADTATVDESGISSATGQSSSIPEQVASAQENLPTSYSIGISVVVSHIDSPNDFYIQWKDSLNSIDELQAKIQATVSEMPILENPTAGVLCAAPYSVDQQWYRAQVLDADDDITTVRFIDFGNTDVIDNSTTQIKTLPQNLLTLEVYATRCSLKIKPVEGEWSTASHDRFAELVDSEITAEFLDQDEKNNYIELYVEGVKVTDTLVRENLATISKDCVPDSKSTCFVSHVNSPSEFWIQLENCADELEWIAEQLSDAENFAELEDVTPGNLCVAQYEDGMWYRARILSNTVAGIELLFLDYGNSSISTNLRQIPEELVLTAPLAQKCSLKKPDNVTEWSQAAVEAFSEVAADGQTIFTVQKITTGETSVVDLFVNGENVLNCLVPTTEEGIIRNYNSTSEFQIEKNGVLLLEKFKIKNPSEVSWSEESEEYFKTVCSKGEPLQIQFLPQNTVRLFLNGKDIVSLAKIFQNEPEKSVEQDSHSQLPKETIDVKPVETVLKQEHNLEPQDKEDAKSDVTISSDFNCKLSEDKTTIPKLNCEISNPPELPKIKTEDVITSESVASEISQKLVNDVTARVSEVTSTSIPKKEENPDCDKTENKQNLEPVSSSETDKSKTSVYSSESTEKINNSPKSEVKVLLDKIIDEAVDVGCKTE